MAEQSEQETRPAADDLVPGRNGGRIAKPWDSARAIEANRRRWARAEHAARVATINAVGSYDPEVAEMAGKSVGHASVLAWAAIVGQQAEKAMWPEDQGSTGAARFVGQSTGMLRGERDRDTVTMQSAGQSDPDLAELVAAWRAAKAANPMLAAAAAAALAEQEGR